MADDTLTRLTAIQQRINTLPGQRAEIIAEARAHGHSWPEIGRALGMSHQGAMKAANQR